MCDGGYGKSPIELLLLGYWLRSLRPLQQGSQDDCDFYPFHRGSTQHVTCMLLATPRFRASRIRTRALDEIGVAWPPTLGTSGGESQIPCEISSTNVYGVSANEVRATTRWSLGGQSSTSHSSCLRSETQAAPPGTCLPLPELTSALSGLPRHLVDRPGVARRWWHVCGA